jgi:hypothetical protein
MLGGCTSSSDAFSFNAAAKKLFDLRFSSRFPFQTNEQGYVNHIVIPFLCGIALQLSGSSPTEREARADADRAERPRRSAQARLQSSEGRRPLHFAQHVRNWTPWGW